MQREEFVQFRVEHRKRKCWELILDFFRNGDYELSMSEAAELRMLMKDVWGQYIDEEGRNREDVVPIQTLHGEIVSRFFSSRYGVNYDDHMERMSKQRPKEVTSADWHDRHLREFLAWVRTKRDEQTSEAHFAPRERR